MTPTVHATFSFQCRAAPIKWYLCKLFCCVSFCFEYNHHLLIFVWFMNALVHRMMTSSNGNIFRVTGHLCREFTGHKGQWRGSLIFFFYLCLSKRLSKQARGGDLRRHRAHYDVTVMGTAVLPVMSYIFKSHDYQLFIVIQYGRPDHLKHRSASSVNTLRPIQDGWYFPDDIFKCIFLNKNIRISIKIWSLFLGVQLTISQHWFRWWLGADQATSHYLNQ